MSREIEITNEQKLKLAEKALLKVLKRIQAEPKIAYFMGVGSETFEYVTAAFSALNGQPLDEVREKTFEGSAAISASMEDILETVH